MSAQGTSVPGKGDHEWGHSGRESSPSGTEGYFDIMLDGEKIGKVYWDCPWSGSNKIQKHDVKSGYSIEFDGFSIPSGALGKGQINVRED